MSREHSQTIPDSDPTYIHSFEDKGYSDLTLIIGSDHGCSDTLTRTEAVFLNGYEAEIAAVPFINMFPWVRECNTSL